MRRYIDNMDSSVKDPFGGLMPPCIVMEKGESLQDRALNSRIDVFTAAQARSRVLSLLLLSDVGYVKKPNSCCL